MCARACAREIKACACAVCVCWYIYVYMQVSLYGCVSVCAREKQMERVCMCVCVCVCVCEWKCGWMRIIPHYLGLNGFVVEIPTPESIAMPLCCHPCSHCLCMHARTQGRLPYTLPY